MQVKPESFYLLFISILCWSDFCLGFSGFHSISKQTDLEEETGFGLLKWVRSESVSLFVCSWWRRWITRCVCVWCSLWWAPAGFRWGASLSSWVSLQSICFSDISESRNSLRVFTTRKMFISLTHVTQTHLNPFLLILHPPGSNGPQKFCIEKVGKETWLPRSHTWWVFRMKVDITGRWCSCLTRFCVFAALTGWICPPTKATSSWKRSCSLRLRRRKDSVKSDETSFLFTATRQPSTTKPWNLHRWDTNVNKLLSF